MRSVFLVRAHLILWTGVQRGVHVLGEIARRRPGTSSTGVDLIEVM